MNNFVFTFFTLIIILIITSCTSNSSKFRSVNDTEPPVFTSINEVSVPQQQLAAITLVATDNISSVTYSIIGGDSDYFHVNSSTGVVVFKQLPYFATKNSYTFTAIAKDTSDNNASQNVIINILETSFDVTKPVFTSSDTATVMENRITAITLVAVDDLSSITYSINEGDSAYFDVNSTTGIVKFLIPPDFETKQTYSFTATATDSSGNSEDQSVTILITDEDIVHNNIHYESAESSYTGKIWLDKNLGASNVCVSANDSSCYGDFYQWGRDKDGHQIPSSNTTSIQATNTNSAGTDFITADITMDYDWAKSADADGSDRASKWSRTDGSSICPSLYRVPTITELTVEIDSISTNVLNMSQMFDSYLKLPSAGFRNYSDGSITSQDIYGSIWSSSVNGSKSDYVYFYIGISTGYSNRASARSVRCIKD